MLEAVLPPIFQGRLEDALSRIQSGLGRIIGVQNELEKIKHYLRDICGFTVMAEHVAQEDQELMKLLEKLKDAPYDAEDLLEEFEIEDTRRAAEETSIMRVSDFVSNKVRKVVPSFFNTRGPNLRLKACELSNKLQKIIAECDESQLKQLETEWKKWLKGCRDTSSTIDPSRVFGRDNEINEIMDWLVPTKEPVMGDGGGVQAISILGMGGQGKTALAQRVFEHRKVELHFSLKMWMCASDGFVVTTLGNEIIEAATGRNPNLERRQKLHDYLKNALHEKKFLLVLDDVRDDAECDEWLKLKDLLMPGDRGSRIVVTTRSRRVANFTSDIEPHILKDLSDEACWSLFSLRALKRLNPGEGTHQNLVAIGKEIVKKCKGNPLAVTTLGDLLFSERESKWKRFRDGEMCDIAQNGGYGIFPALRLSYDSLKPHVKQCFAFCAVFPKDYEIDKEYLIMFWMANGFIPTQEGRELEDIGDDIFQELLDNSFFEVTDVNIREHEFPPPDLFSDLFSNNKKTTFKIHSLMHDLAKLVMWEECCIAGQGKTVNISKRVRHISLEIPISSLPETQTLRSYIKLKCESPFPCDFEIFKYFNLRAVHLRQNGRPLLTSSLLTSLGKLQHLRYLDLSCASIERLPESVTHLHYLQTLILRGCGNLRELPKEIVKLTCLRCLDVTGCGNLRELPKEIVNLTSLRYLDVTGCSQLTHMPVKMGQLTCLRELKLFLVGRPIQNACSGIEELQSLNNLRHLSIEHLENVANVNDVHQANLIQKSNLTSLYLGWVRDSSHAEGLGQTEQEQDQRVLEGFKPHRNLKLLKVFGYGGVRFSSWMTDTASTHLVRIFLSQCCICNQLPTLGQLPCLKVLGIKGLKNVESIGNEFYGIYGNDVSQGFRSLETLEITEMDKLTTWSVIGFPQLLNMSIDSCPMLTTVQPFSSSQGMMHCLKSLKSLKISSCNQLENFSIGLRNLISLECMQLKRCNLLSFDGDEIRCLRSLQTLSVDSYDKLFSGIGLRYFSSLRSLEIVNSSNFMHVANELSFLTSLRDLTLKACPGLKSLPEGIGKLTSLNFLAISHCSEMESLPNALKGLTTIKRLNIQGCPTLNDRCKKYTGEDWHKIQHIPCIE